MQGTRLGTEGVLLFDLIHISIAFTLSLAAASAQTFYSSLIS